MQTVSLVHSADIHLGKVRFNSNEEDIDFFNGFNQVVDYCIDNEVDGLLLAGDIFDRHQVTPQTLLRTEKIFNRLKEKEIPVIAIYGNHDGSLIKNEFNWLDYLSQRELVKFLKIPFNRNEAIIDHWNGESKEGGLISLKGINIYGLGYLGSTLEQRIESLIPKVDNEAFNILMLHADFNNRVYDERGSLKDQDLIDKLKEKIDYLALGHVHSCYIKDDWAYNPGSVENWRISEADYEKGFFHITINSETKEKSVNLKKIKRRETFLFEKDKACDLGGCQNVEEVYQRIKEFVDGVSQSITEDSIVRLNLIGGLYFSPGEIEQDEIKKICDSLSLYHLDIVNESFLMEGGLKFRSETLSQADIEREELIYEIEKSSAFKDQSETIAHLIQDVMTKKSEKSISDEELFQQLHQHFSKAL